MKYDLKVQRRRRVRAWILGVAIALGALAVNFEQETLADIRLGDDEDKVFALHGSPPVTKQLGHSDEMGGDLVIYGYRDLRFLVILSPDGGGRVYSITALGSSSALTSQGIGLGASRAEVEEMYGALTPVFEDNYMVGVDQSGRMLAFTIRDDKVVKIVLSQLPG